MNNSNFWLKYEPEGKFNLLELANTQRAITNFVKILTEKEIKVDFQSNNDADSFTNGKRITISSTISMNTIDSVVGTALHEAAHCKYTNFDVLKYLKNTLYVRKIESGHDIIETLLNFIEDRRIDSLVYKTAPGYQGYYRSMYERYFYSKTVDKALKGKIHKAASSKKELNQIEAISKSSIKENKVSAIDKNGVKRTDRKVHVIDGITKSIVDSNLYGIFKYPDFACSNNVNAGINLGKKLLRKLQITNEQVTLASKRLKSGKIDARRVYAANFENDIFYKIDRAQYKPISIHLSIDGSGSMQGEKWNQVLINTVALGYVSLHMQNIDLTISIRTTGEDPSLSSKTAHIPLLILAFDSKKHTLSDLKKLAYFKVSGLTPEGMCLNTLNQYIPSSSYYLDSYLINMSDGFPTFESSGFIYKGKSAILDTAKAVSNIKKKGVKVLSYFIETDVTSIRLNELVEAFRTMYGKSATFIDPKNVHQVTKTLNNLFLKRDLVS
jgi:hypothetical protein